MCALEFFRMIHLTYVFSFLRLSTISVMMHIIDYLPHKQMQLWFSYSFRVRMHLTFPFSSVVSCFWSNAKYHYVILYEINCIERRERKGEANTKEKQLTSVSELLKRHPLWTDSPLFPLSATSGLLWFYLLIYDCAAVRITVTVIVIVHIIVDIIDVIGYVDNRIRIRQVVVVVTAYAREWWCIEVGCRRFNLFII